MESDMHRHGITAIPDFPASATPLDAQRHDLRTAAYVETAIRLQQSHGTSCALEYLQANDVDPVTSGRVLTHPERRRHSL
ncbi:hypothetical protein [Undibacterium aquatile]|uniref:Uncharacterized protein n=1 Tax=Undibacterium aquatile TaxID=1537398 RepID=A0ABR6XGK3_9BURK|nr:hypothetical protein [Undibacterium aquatile]MBC3811991.1 hypothetical protein [Undibacterium aquatile]